MRWAQFVALPGRHCWMGPPQFNRTSTRRFHTRCRNRPRRPFHREVQDRYLGQQIIEPFEEHDRPEGLRVSKRRRPCHRRALRCPRIRAVSRTGRIAPLNLSALTAAQNVAIGPSRHFAAVQQTVAFWGITDIESLLRREVRVSAGAIYCARSASKRSSQQRWQPTGSVKKGGVRNLRTHTAAFRANDCIDDGTDRCPARYFSSLWFTGGQGSCTAVVPTSFRYDIFWPKVRRRRTMDAEMRQNRPKRAENRYDAKMAKC